MEYCLGNALKSTWVTMQVVHRKVQIWLLKRRSKSEKTWGNLKKQNQTIRLGPAMLASFKDQKLMQIWLSLSIFLVKIDELVARLKTDTSYRWSSKIVCITLTTFSSRTSYWLRTSRYMSLLWLFRRHWIRLLKHLKAKAHKIFYMI